VGRFAGPPSRIAVAGQTGRHAMSCAFVERNGSIIAASTRRVRSTCHVSRIAYHAVASACVVLLALAGCAGGPSSKTSYYALSVEGAPARAEQATATGAATGTRVAVTRVGIPGEVDRPQMVSRAAANSVEVFDFHRWAEPLQEAIPRVIAGDLARQ